MDMPLLKQSLPIHFGYKQISAIHLECPSCGKDYLEDNMLAKVRESPDGVTTGKGVCRCHFCRTQAPLEFVFRANGSAEIIVGDKSIKINPGNFLALLAHSVLLWSIALYRRYIPLPPQSAPEIPLMKFVSKRRSPNIIGYYENKPMFEWVELEGKKYYFSRVLYNENDKMWIEQDEVIVSGSFIYKLRQEKAS
jgi:hypothetical protein